MVTVCAWCQRYMGLKEPLDDPVVTHGICPTCSLRHQIGEMPTLVVAREWAHTLPVLRALLAGSPEIRLVLDRREGERRHGARPVGSPAERRRPQDRRQGVALFIA